MAFALQVLACFCGLVIIVGCAGWLAAFAIKHKFDILAMVTAGALLVATVAIVLFKYVK